MRLFHIGLVALLCGCGGGSSTGPSPETATVVFVLDGQTCAAADYPLHLFINGVSRGIYTYHPGDAGQRFSVLPGSVALSATIEGTAATWGPATVFIGASQTYTYTMRCQ